MSACYLEDGPAVAICVGCGRGLCELHQVRKSGLAMTVFGPFFDDRRPRCGDCYAKRFRNGYIAFAVIVLVTVAIALLLR